jgi:hypothetical protein
MNSCKDTSSTTPYLGGVNTTLVVIRLVRSAFSLPIILRFRHCTRLTVFFLVQPFAYGNEYSDVGNPEVA